MSLQELQHCLRSLNVQERAHPDREETLRELDELQNAISGAGLWVAWAADAQLYVVVDKEMYWQQRD